VADKKTQFISEVMGAAVAIQKKHGLNAAAITAQVCLETGYGQYVATDINTGQYSYNLFNIKGTGSAGSVLVNTWEVYNGVRKKVQAYFKAYRNYEEGFASYVRLMQTDRYAPCRAAVNDPDEYCRQLQACGYATDPVYSAKLIKIMDMYGLRKMAEEAIFKLDKTTILIDGEKVADGYLVDDRNYAPAGIIAIKLGIPQEKLQWDASTKTLNIITK